MKVRFQKEGTLTKETRFVFSVIPQTKPAESLHSENASNDAQSSLVRHGEIAVFSGAQKVVVIPVTDETDDVKARVQKDAEDVKLTKAVAAHVAVEDSGRCVIEAENGTAVSNLDAAGWKAHLQSWPFTGKSFGSKDTWCKVVMSILLNTRW